MDCHQPEGRAVNYSDHEILSDVAHDMGSDPGLEKDGVEAHLQELLYEYWRRM